MSQTTYNTAPLAAVAGMVADSNIFKDIVTGIALATNGAIKFGRAVRVVTAPAAGGSPIVELPNATGEITGDSFLGITVADTGREGTSGSTSFSGYATGDVLNVLRRGRIWVTSEDAVSAVMGQVFVRFTADANPIGGFRTDADTDEAVALPGSHFLTTCSAGGLVLIEFQAQD